MDITAGVETRPSGSTPRTRTALFGAFLSLAMITSIVVFAIQADGREGTESSTNDGGAWLVNQRAGSIGHVNRTVRELSAAVRVSQPLASFDVYQPQGIVAVHDRTVNTLAVVDERVHLSTNSVDVPKDLDIRGHTAGLAIQANSPYRIWNVSSGQLAEIGSLEAVTPIYEGDATVFGVSAKGSVLVAQSDGSLLLIDDGLPEPIVGSTLTDNTGDPRPIEHVMFDGDQGLVTIGSRIGVIEEGRVQLLEDEIDPWLRAGEPSATRTGSLVVVTRDQRVVRIDTSDGSARSLGRLNSSRVEPPIEHQGCVYALTNEPAEFWVQCGSDPSSTTTLPGQNSDVRLRLVNGWIWINDVATGNLWFVDDDFELSPIDDWGAVLPRNESTDTSDLPPTDGQDNVVTDVENPDAEDSEIIDADEFDEDGVNQPPVAFDDLDVRVPQGRPAVVNVVGNDTDPDNDVLLIAAVVNESGSDANITASADGTRIQVTPAPDFVGVIRYSYTIADGRGGSDTADGSVVVVQSTGESNRPPVAVTDIAAITAGDRLILNVVANDTDPDGDSLVLVDASAPDGTISFDPSGQIIFEPASTSEDGEIELTYVISDDFGERVEGIARVLVRLKESNQPPDARNDGAITVVGQPITINVLANDVDPDGDDLFVAQRPALLSPAGVDVFTTISPDGEFVMIPDAPGTYIFSYAASDDEASDIAQIRIEVNEAEGNRPPVALRDDVVVPTGSSRLVYALANDSDPDGDVIGIVDLAVPPGSGMRVERFLDVGFRVFVDGAGPSRRTFSYSISDGKAPPVRTTVVVAVAETTSRNNPPVAEPDTIEVRAGTSVSVAVLDNDFDPEGGTLRVVAVSSNDGAQTAIGPGGQSVRLTVLPETTTSFTLNYDVVDDQQNRTASIIRVRVVPAGEANRPPIARPDDARTRFEEPVNIAVIANDSDPDGDPIRVESITVQPSFGTVTIDQTSGEVIYLPARGFSGTDRFSYTITDALGARSTGEVLVGVLEAPAPNRDPIATDDSFLTIATGQQISLTVLDNDSDPDGDQLSISSMGAVSVGEATIVPERNAIDYIAPIDQPNDVTVTFEYTISDRNGGSATATVTVLVQATPPLPDGVTLPPIATDDFVGPVTSGTPLRIDVVDNDRDPDTAPADLTVELPELGSTNDDNIGATVTGQTITLLAPQESAEFSYQLVDPDGNIGSATVFITVINPIAPVAVDDSAGPVKQGDIVVVEALLNDFDPDGEPTALEIVSVSGAEATTNGSSISIEAPEASSQYVYTIRDADDLESTAVVSLIVTENRAPTVEASAFSTDFGESIEIDLSSTASDPDGDPLLFACCQSARDGSPDVVAAGENQLIVRFTPNDGFSGDAVFTYQVDDQFGHQVAGSTTITVGEQPNRPPTTVDGAATIAVPRPGGEPFTVDIDLAALTDDPDGDDLVWALTTQPGADLTAAISGSTLTLTSTDQSDAGQTSLTWAATDPEAESSEATVSITVEQAQNTAPTASDDSVTVPAGASTTVNLEPLTTDPDTNENLSFEIDAPPTSGLTSTLTGRAEVTIAAAVNEVGTTTAITYTVTDRLGEDATATIQVTVGEPNQAPPTASPDTASTLQGQAVDIDVLTNDNDPIGTGLTIVSPGGSTDGTLELIGSAIRFTPTVDFFGTTEFIYTIRDAADTASREATATVSVEVTGRPSAPSPPTCTASSREASLVWTAPTGNGAPVTDYILNYEEADSRVQGSTDITTSGTSATVSPLQNGQGYQFKVQALNIAGASDWSDWSTTCTPDIRPEQPAPPQVTHGPGWLDLTWDRPTNEGSDIIEYEVQIGGGAIQTSTDTSMRWRDLENGTDYTFQVAARNQAGLSDFSSSSTPEHPSTTPSAPVIGVTTRAGLIGASASGILQVNWTPVPVTADGGDTIVQYRIERRSGTDVTVTGANASNYVWSGLDNGTPQEFRVFAENRDGESPPSAWSSAVEACTVPDAPTSASAVEGDTTATVSFGDPFDDGGCDVSTYDMRILGETTNVSTVPASGSHPVSGLLNAIPVAFEIRAVNVIGNGPWVATNSVTPAGLPICSSEIQQSLINQSEASIYIVTPANFNGGTDLGYELNTNNAGWVPLAVSPFGTALSATFDTPPNTNLTIDVRAVNQIGATTCGSLSFLSCSPDPPAPAAPTQSGSLVFRDIQVNWTTPTIPCHSQTQSHTDTAIRHYEVDPDPGAPFEETGLFHLITHVDLGTATRTRVRACDIDSCGAWSPWSSDVTLPASVQVQLNFSADPDFYPVTGLSITDYDVSRDLARTTIFGRVNSQGFINAPLPATDPNLPAGSIQYDTLFATYNGEPVCFGYRFDNFFDAGQSLNGVGVFGC